MLYAGIATTFPQNNNQPRVAISIRNSTYFLVFFSPEDIICHDDTHTSDEAIVDCVIKRLVEFVCRSRVPRYSVQSNITLQLYPRERFAVKLSETLHKSKLVIATMVMVIPLEVQHGKYGFSVNVGESNAVANHLYDLCTDSDLYNRMNHQASRVLVMKPNSRECVELAMQAEWGMDPSHGERGSRLPLSA